MKAGNFKKGTLGDITIPSAWHAIVAAPDPLPFLCRQLYNASGSSVTATVKMVGNDTPVAIPIGPWGYLDGYFTAVTIVTTSNVLFGAE